MAKAGLNETKSPVLSSTHRRLLSVYIVGGGFTGLWTAMFLKEREPSLEVALLGLTSVGQEKVAATAE